MAVDTKLIAVCGVDGSGKSSLVDAMERRGLLPDCAYLRRPKSPDANGPLVGRYARREHGDGRDWISGDFAEAMGVALAYDFLEHYHNNVRPLLGRKRFIVCDRFTLCFVAYLNSIGSPFPIEAAYARTRRPDLTLYVQVPPEVHDERLLGRSGRADDEHPEVSANFHGAYLELLPCYSQEYDIVDNGGPFEDTVAAAFEAVSRRFSEAEAFYQKGEDYESDS